VCVLVAEFVVGYYQTSIMQQVGQRIMYDLRMQLFEKLQRMSLPFYDRNPVGRLMTRITGDVDVLNELFTSAVVTIVGDIVTLIGIMAAIVVLNPELGAVTFSVLPLIVLVTLLFRKNVPPTYRHGPPSRSPWGAPPGGSPGCCRPPRARSPAAMARR